MCWNRQVRQVLRCASWKHREDLSRSLRSRVHHYSPQFFSAVVGCCRDNHTDRLLPIPLRSYSALLALLGGARTASGHEPPVNVQHRDTEKKTSQSSPPPRFAMQEHLWNKTTEKMRSNANDPCPVQQQLFLDATDH